MWGVETGSPGSVSETENGFLACKEGRETEKSEVLQGGTCAWCTPLKTVWSNFGRLKPLAAKALLALFDLPCSFECGPRVEQGNPVEDAKRVGPEKEVLDVLNVQGTHHPKEREGDLKGPRSVQCHALPP